MLTGANTHQVTWFIIRKYVILISSILYISSSGSPTDRPPMALPSIETEAAFSADCFLNHRKYFLDMGKDIADNPCGFRFLNLATALSSHLWVSSIDFLAYLYAWNRAHSSKAIIISARKSSDVNGILRSKNAGFRQCAT